VGIRDALRLDLEGRPGTDGDVPHAAELDRIGLSRRLEAQALQVQTVGDGARAPLLLRHDDAAALQAPGLTAGHERPRSGKGERPADAGLSTGGGRRDRTDDLLLAKQALSQLSYAPAWLGV
jgi:hypothetical protein